MSAVPRLSPHLTRPYWLAPLADVLRRCFLASAGLGPPVRAGVSVPSQHGKTVTIETAIAEWLRHRPQDPILYASYNDDIVKIKSGEIRDLARLNGVQIRSDARSKSTWTTTRGGGLLARALVGGPITGMPGLRLVVIDDPYKGRREAESAAWRRDVWESFTSNVFSRLHPTTSVLINHTRWHEDDLYGKLKREHGDGWEFHNLPAINDAGEALWPEGQPPSLLAEKRAMSEYDWWSIYMGQPRSREGKLFHGISYFDEAPPVRRVAIGVDLAYTAKSSADWSVAVVMAEAHGQYYVLDVLRRQTSAPDFASELRSLVQRYPGAPVLSYMQATERGTASFFRQMGIPLTERHASLDKFQRAQPVAAAWKAGKIHIPARAPGGSQPPTWVGPYTSVILDFSGLGDAYDDDVDATAAAFDALSQGTLAGPPVQLPESLLDHRPRRDPAIRSRRNKGIW